MGWDLVFNLVQISPRPMSAGGVRRAFQEWSTFVTWTTSTGRCGRPPGTKCFSISLPMPTTVVSQPNQDSVFFKRAAFFSSLKTKAGHIIVKAFASRSFIPCYCFSRSPPSVVINAPIIALPGNRNGRPDHRVVGCLVTLVPPSIRAIGSHQAAIWC